MSDFPIGATLPHQLIWSHFLIQIAMKPARERQTSGDQLSELARQMADSANPDEVQRLREEIHRGFYGE